MFKQKPANIFFIFKKEDYHPIHSFFVRYNFDAIYLDKKFKVVDKISNIKPNSLLIKPKKKNLYLLELEPKVTKKFKIEIGDKLIIDGEKNV
jgi:uncharacterized membrane protein (UPF0127 family)